MDYVGILSLALFIFQNIIKRIPRGGHFYSFTHEWVDSGCVLSHVGQMQKESS